MTRVLIGVGSFPRDPVPGLLKLPPGIDGPRVPVPLGGVVGMGSRPPGMLGPGFFSWLGGR